MSERPLRRRALLAGVLLLGRVPASKAGEAGTPLRLPPLVGLTEVYSSESGRGLSGYDPVSYWTDIRGRPGHAEHELVWEGLAWRFVSGANRAAFRRDPEAFLPRLGGYDAAAAAGGRIVKPDPEVHAFIGGALYLFRSEEARRLFLEAGAPVAEAEESWLSLKARLVRG